MSDERLHFENRIKQARGHVNAARGGDKKALADALRALGNIERRRPGFREDANRTHTEAAAIYSELDLQLDEAWVIRHTGINHEYAGRFDEAEMGLRECLRTLSQAFQNRRPRLRQRRPIGRRNKDGTRQN